MYQLLLARRARIKNGEEPVLVDRAAHLRSRALMSTYAASTSSARAAESTSEPGRSFTWPPALAGPLEQAGRVLQQRTKEETNVGT